MSAPLQAAVAIAVSRAGSRVPIVGVAGAQGAGKTTLLRDFASSFGGKIAQFSLDDVYLAADARVRLAQRIHPLFATRGPPGTHDLALLHETLDALQAASSASLVPIPVFDKLTDNPLLRHAWPVFAGRPSLVIVDGWCLGAAPQDARDLYAPVNDLESREDAAGVWRRAVNDELASAYQSVFTRLDAILHLRAPSFDVVARWRGEQEAGLLGRTLSEEEGARIARFVAHFERITRHMLAGGVREDIAVDLDESRRVLAFRERR
jgi:D-glycerate 3-kinase